MHTAGQRICLYTVANNIKAPQWCSSWFVRLNRAMHANVSSLLTLFIVIFSTSIDCRKKTVHVSVLKDDTIASRNATNLIESKNQEQSLSNSDAESAPSYLKKDWRTLDAKEYDQLVGDLEKITNRFLTHISIIEAYEQGHSEQKHSLEMRLAFDPFEWQLLSRLGPLARLADGELAIAGLNRVDFEIFLRLLDAAGQTGHGLLFSKDSAYRLHKILAVVMRKLIAMDAETFIDKIEPIPTANVRMVVKSLFDTKIYE